MISNINLIIAMALTLASVLDLSNGVIDGLSDIVQVSLSESAHIDPTTL